MTAANSFTGNISTNGEFQTIESLTVGVTGSNFTGFTAGKTYNLCIQNSAYVKVSDAIFPIHNEKFDYKPNADDDIYIKTDYSSTNNIYCILTILEVTENS